MATEASRLRQRPQRIDGRGYKAYRDIKGRYGFTGFELNAIETTNPLLDMG